MCMLFVRGTQYNMGNTPGVPTGKEEEYQAGWPSSWKLADVHALRKRWIKVCGMEFGVERKGQKGLSTLFDVAGRDVTEAYLDYMWEMLMRPMGNANRIDALGVIAIYYILCDAPVEDKVVAVFKLFDFNANEKISKDELTILFMSTCYALLAFLDKIPTEAESLKAFETRCETLAIEGFAFSKMNRPDADGNVDNIIDKNEFKGYITQELDLNRDGELDINELLSFFNAVLARKLKNRRQMKR